MGRRLAAGVAAALVAAVLIAACGPDRASRHGKGGQGSGNGEGVAGGLTQVRLQLQWFTQAQFAGYIAARDKGFYTEPFQSRFS
ncbi:hypothetical protein ACG83_03130 [Frankia sp. R43]|uniref:hypothetical protein n=1 Tax=Frankia sp. R43 TaxID=269536 RepID=UPI0006CA5C7A|nr:hypothetical protein [Frankia sp. R43]KPM56855.1 hypothetical protein ACG83_03130 [Frankia sp. R43]